MVRNLYFLFSALLLIYLCMPGPSSIGDFTPLPESAKSNLDGDTVQVPNVAAFFSFKYRNFVTSFYKDNFHKLTMLPFPPVRLNHPPETAYQYIKEQTQSTYLEEYVYPLRGSLFINGFEPFLEDGTSRFLGAVQFGFGDKNYDTKTTIRFYPAPLAHRLLIWLGINLSLVGLYRLVRRLG